MIKKGSIVMPLRDPVPGDGTVWEWLLSGTGWNELPKEVKPGRVLETYTNGTLDVYFPAVNHLAKCIFDDEIKEV